MAYFALHAYDADVWLREFRGLNQADESLNPDIRYAVEAMNVETPLGVLQPQAPTVQVVKHGEFTSNRVETLAVLHRRWYTGVGSNRWYIAAAGGKLYHKQANSETEWNEIPMPLGMDHFESNAWSCVTYESNEPDPENPGEYVTIDVLLISNSCDGMFMIVPPDKLATWGIVKNSTWDDLKSGTWADVLSPVWGIRQVDTRTNPEDDEEPQKKFAVIERHGERIFGTGVPGEPDTIYYSKAYNPTDWTLDEDIPENSAGEVKQPSWDGDKFFGLRRSGDQLLALKNNKIWRVLGLGPGEYVFNEQYGRGTKYSNTIAVMGEKVIMASEQGVLIYDGMDTVPFATEQIKEIWKSVNQGALDQMCAALIDKKYYLAIPTGDSEVNNAVIVFDFNENTILYYPDMYVESFLPADNILFATTSTLPGQILMIQKDSWKIGKASGAPTKWVSPWIDFGYKRIKKGGFDLYFLPEVQDDPVDFTISIQTEKKEKTKVYTCDPISESDRSFGKEHRMKRLHFGGSGRRFRIIIETSEGVTSPWRLIGGLQIIVETDPD